MSVAEGVPELMRRGYRYCEADAFSSLETQHRPLGHSKPENTVTFFRDPTERLLSAAINQHVSGFSQPRYHDLLQKCYQPLDPKCFVKSPRHSPKGIRLGWRTVSDSPLFCCCGCISTCSCEVPGGEGLPGPHAHWRDLRGRRRGRGAAVSGERPGRRPPGVCGAEATTTVRPLESAESA